VASRNLAIKPKLMQEETVKLKDPYLEERDTP
jgi:hypothetical protein